MDSGRNKNSDKRVKCPLQRGHRGRFIVLLKRLGGPTRNARLLFLSDTFADSVGYSLDQKTTLLARVAASFSLFVFNVL